MLPILWLFALLLLARLGVVVSSPINRMDATTPRVHDISSNTKQLLTQDTPVDYKKSTALIDYELRSVNDQNGHGDDSNKRQTIGFKVVLLGVLIPSKSQMLQFMDGTQADSLGRLFKEDFELFKTNLYGYELFKSLQNEILFDKILNYREKGLVSSLFEPLIGKQALRFLFTKILTDKGNSIKDYTFNVFNNPNDSVNSLFCISKDQSKNCAIVNQFSTIKIVPLNDSQKLYKRSDLEDFTEDVVDSILLAARRGKNRAVNVVEDIKTVTKDSAKSSIWKVDSIKNRLDAAADAFLGRLQDLGFKPTPDYDPYDLSGMNAYRESSVNALSEDSGLHHYKRTLYGSPRNKKYSQVLPE